MSPSFIHVSQALSHQEKAVMSSERVQGIDHPQTIQDYVSFSSFSFIQNILILFFFYLTLLM